MFQMVIKRPGINQFQVYPELYLDEEHAKVGAFKIGCEFIELLIDRPIYVPAETPE
jgi:hypothetical protein